jgi:UDP-N-acetylmuramoyl-L-alanyl-D-glutamate--2,6-diaminopimelate ligase
LETTSHGLTQHRVAACEFDVGILTNITHEHLDEHGSYSEYLTAKASLFESLSSTIRKPQGNPRLAVLNRDDSSFSSILSIVNARKITYGHHPDAEVTATDIHYSAEGIRLMVKGINWEVPVASELVGEFNVMNILAALTAAVYGLDIDPNDAAAGIARLKEIPGRMESINLGQDFSAIVDFAHTPNALRRAIETTRKISDGQVIVVFGSAGLRDREKRRMMAEISAELADITILTAEDPRTESLEMILSEMADGMESRGCQEGKNFWRIPDRGQAIRFALKLAEPGDVVIACGKGHEQSMCFGEIEYSWDDRTAVRAALAEFLGINGPEMPYLPTAKPKKSA